MTRPAPKSEPAPCCGNCAGLLPLVQHCERILILGQPLRELPKRGVCFLWMEVGK